MKDQTARTLLLFLLVASLFARAWRLDQPIVENYVGRQIPTAMVARNLDRGSGFLHPQLDTGPFPNLFLVEPPIYQTLVVIISRFLQFSLSQSGRLVSAVASTLAVWALFGLVRKREGNAVALMASTIFAVAPITFRYGRAFQPDMLMIALQLTAVRLWDSDDVRPTRMRIAFAWILLASALAVKITSSYILIPLVYMTAAKKRPLRACLLVSSAVPALLWYLHAALLLKASEGSRASSDNLAIWFRSISESWNLESIIFCVKYLCVRSFTPFGFGFAVIGFCLFCRPGDRFWRVWGLSALGALVILGRKAHHEYYWLAVAPIVAAGAGRGLARCWGWGVRGKFMSIAASFCLAITSIGAGVSTYRTPDDWAGLASARVEIQKYVPTDSLVVAPEALLFESDRRGARLEFDPAAVSRSAGEWGATLEHQDALSLVDFLKTRGIRFVADVGPAPLGTSRASLRDSLRSRDPSSVLVDRPDVFLATLPVKDLRR